MKTRSKDGTIFTVCLYTFPLFWLRKTIVSVRISQLIFCVLFYVFFIWRPLHLFGKVINFYSYFCFIRNLGIYLFHIFSVWIKTVHMQEKFKVLMWLLFKRRNSCLSRDLKQASSCSLNYLKQVQDPGQTMFLAWSP